MNKEAAYWIALAHLPKWGHLTINRLIIKFFHESGITIEDFFELSEQEWKILYSLDEKQIGDLKQAKQELPGNAFLAETLFSQGFEIIPIISKEYSKTLKENLKTSHCPALLYIKGNKNILKEESVAIVGSRDASDVALQFTDNMAKHASEDNKAVVSGFAKGVDKQALDSAIKYKGQSIIVLPQGIMTFTSGFKDYYRQIINGDVLVLSTFYPKAPWKTELAMARNPIIYGLANDIYVAESSEKGGTWSGVIDGLRKGRVIFVRSSQPTEKNANNILIQRGAVPVDFDGNLQLKSYQISEPKQTFEVHEDSSEYESVENKIRSILTNEPLTAKSIIKNLNLEWTPQKMNLYLKKLDFVEVIKNKNVTSYILKGKDPQKDIFD